MRKQGRANRKIAWTLIGNCISEAAVTSCQIDGSKWLWYRTHTECKRQRETACVCVRVVIGARVTTYLPEVTDSVGERSLGGDVCWVAWIMVNLSNRMINQHGKIAVGADEHEKSRKK